VLAAALLSKVSRKRQMLKIRIEQFNQLFQRHHGQAHTKTETFAQKAVAAEPNIPQYLFNLAATERMIGALSLAEAHCDAAIALQPNYCFAHYLRVDLRTQTRERNHIADMKAVIRSGTLGLSDEVLMHFALGKEYEDVEEHVRAFDHVAAACALHRNSFQYEPLREIAEIDHITRTQTRDWSPAASFVMSRRDLCRRLDRALRKCVPVDHSLRIVGITQ
jgi:hypothetical protein